MVVLMMIMAVVAISIAQVYNINKKLNANK